MKAPSVSKLRVGGRDFAVVPWREYQRLAANGKAKSPSDKRLSAEDAGDAAEVRRRSGEPSKPYGELRRKLGLG